VRSRPYLTRQTLQSIRLRGRAFLRGDRFTALTLAKGVSLTAIWFIGMFFLIYAIGQLPIHPAILVAAVILTILTLAWLQGSRGDEPRDEHGRLQPTALDHANGALSLVWAAHLGVGAVPLPAAFALFAASFSFSVYGYHVRQDYQVVERRKPGKSAK
jgi:hypothetical protein